MLLAPSLVSSEPPRMVLGVYLASGSSLFTLVAMPAPPSTSSRAEATQKAFHSLVLKQ